MHRVLLMAVAGLGAAAIMSGTALASDGGSAKPASPPQNQPSPKTYVVQSGDNLSTIAQSQNLDSWRPLWNANANIEDPNLIYADEQLTVPDGPTTDRPIPEGMMTPPPVAPVQQSYQPVQSSGQVNRAPAHTAANYAAGAGGILERIRMRESGGNYATNTGNGFYGAYQFTIGTWQGVGGSGLPSDASPAEQDMRAQMLYNQRGCSPWPNTCY